MPKLRGRAASVVRVGMVIKDTLNGIIPDESGNLVNEAAIVDVHHVYKRLVREQNMLKKHKMKPMVYSSFVCQFRFAEKLNLVQLVRKEDMLFPPPTGHLYTFKVHDGNIGEIAMRHIYSLTELGKADDLSWTNLTQAYIQHWMAPQPAPEYEHIIHVYKFNRVPTRDQIIAFREYLKLGTAEKKDIELYSEKVGDWSMYFEDRFNSSQNKDYKKLQGLADTLSELLTDNKIAESIEILGNMALIMSDIHMRVGKVEKEVKKDKETEQEENESEIETESEPETEVVDEDSPSLEQVKSTLKGFVEKEHASGKIKNFKELVESLNQELYTNIDELLSAIDDYQEITHKGRTPDEYSADKEDAIDAIYDEIDNIEEINNDNE